MAALVALAEGKLTIYSRAPYITQMCTIGIIIPVLVYLCIVGIPNQQSVLYSNLPAIVKLSVLLAAVLRHITVVSLLMIILDAVTCKVEVKLEFRGLPLLSISEAVKGLRSKSSELELVVYVICSVMSGLRHSRIIDPNTRQVNVTRSPGHVNCLSLFEVSSTFSTDSRGEETWRYLY